MTARAPAGRDPMVVVAVALAVVAVAVVALTLAEIADLHTPLPYLDQWSVVDEIGKIRDGSWSVDDLWSQHNEHRPVIPRLFFYADYWLGDGENYLTAILMPAFQLVSAALIVGAAWLVVRDRRDGGPIAAGALAVALAMQFTTAQIENFITGYNVQFDCGFAFALGSFAALLLPGIRRHRRPLLPPVAAAAIAVVLAALAQLSIANGLACWPLLALAAAWCGFPRRYWAAFIAVGALVTLLYFIGYERPPDGADPVEGIKHPLRLIEFFLLLMGSPFIVLFDTTVAKVLGAVALLSAVPLVVDAIRRRDREAGVVFLYSVMAFVLIGTAIIAAGRSPLGEVQATSPRYAQGPAAYWACLAILWGVALLRARGVLARLAPQFLFGFLVATALATYWDAVDPWEERFHSLGLTEDSIRSGVYDRNQIAFIYPPERAAEVVALISVLRDGHYSVFNGSNDSDYLGLPISTFQSRPAACVGAFDGSVPVDATEGAGVGGWAWDTSKSGLVDKVLLADSSGTIVGFANHRVPRPDVPPAVGLVKSDDSGWFGYSLASATPVTAYALVADGVCALVGQHSVTAGASG